MRCDKEIDKVVGARIHELRLAMGMSRVELAEKIGVSHQQCQKYERGLNRICVARLIKVAKAFNKSTTYFLIGLDDDTEEKEIPSQHRRMCLEVSRNFMKIKSGEHQQAVNILIKSLAE